MGPDLQISPECEALTKTPGTWASVKKQKVKERAANMAFPILL